MNNSSKKIYDNDYNLNLVNLFNHLFSYKFLIIKVVLVFTFLGIFYSLSIKNRYTSSYSILPQYSSNNSDVSSLENVASIAGINLGEMKSNSDSELSPLLYPQIFNSINFSKKLLYQYVFDNNNKKITLIDYLKTNNQSILMNLFNFKNDTLNKFNQSKNDKILSLSIDEYNYIKILKEKLNIQIRRKEGYFTVVSTFEDPEISSQVALGSTDLLQNEIINIKIKKSNEKLTFIEKRYLDHKNDFIKIQNELAEFKDKNINIRTSLQRVELDRLETRYNIAYNLYLNSSNLYEKQLIQVKEDTPIFTVLEDLYIPIEKSYPNRTLIVVSFLILGFILSFLLIFLKSIKSFKF